MAARKDGFKQRANRFSHARPIRAPRPPAWPLRLVQSPDNPRRTAAAFAVGVFLGFTPFLGLQVLLSLIVASFLRLNYLAIFVGLNVNLPWIVAPWYAGTTLVAAWLMGIRAPEGLQAQIEGLFVLGLRSWELPAAAWGFLAPLVLPFVVGPTCGAAVAGVLAYVAVSRVLNRRSSALHRAGAESV